LHTRQQFREGKRLDEVVVPASAQSAHPIVDLTERADDEGGRGDAGFPQTPNDGDAVNSRKHAIDRHHRIFGRASAAQPVVAVDREINLVAVRCEGLHKLLGRLRVVFNDKNAAPTSRHDVAPPTAAMNSIFSFYHTAAAQKLTY